MTIGSKLALGLCLLTTSACVVADGLVVTRNGAATAPFSSTIWAGDTLYVAGMLPEATVPAGAPAGTRGTITGDTRAQTASTLQSIRRRVIVNLQSTGGDLITVSVRVDKEIEDLSGLAANYEGGATFPESQPLNRDLDQVVGQTGPSRWLSIGRDPMLERQVLSQIQGGR